MNEFQDKILDNKTVVLDVRTEEEYYGPLGHINGSILIPINELEDRLSELNDYKEKLFMLYAEVETDQDLEKIF